jgi:hypothetical protein
MIPITSHQRGLEEMTRKKMWLLCADDIIECSTISELQNSHANSPIFSAGWNETGETTLLTGFALPLDEFSDIGPYNLAHGSILFLTKHLKTVE